MAPKFVVPNWKLAVVPCFQNPSSRVVNCANSVLLNLLPCILREKTVKSGKVI